MPTINFEGKCYTCRDSETVLEALLRHGVSLPFSCRSGICHVCMMRCVSGDLDEQAQAGIKPELQKLGYFLPCSCRLGDDLEIALPRSDELYVHAQVNAKDMLSPSVCRLVLEPLTAFDYQPGQFINLRRYDGLARSYSLASVESDYFLELHVRRRQSGVLSNWIFDELQVNEEVEISGASGNNYYPPGNNRDQPLLMIGTGTGLAPLWGILRQALDKGHNGPIHLYHGSRYRDGLYLHDALLELQDKVANFHYHPCLSGNGVPDDFRADRADTAALLDHASLVGWRVHIAGAPDMVESAQLAVYRAGARSTDVIVDPFELTDLRTGNRSNSNSGRRADDDAATPREPWKKPEVEYPPPDLELWSALQEGALLKDILSDFYNRVYADPQLSPYFVNVTKKRLIDKQYSFLKRIITGEPSYFGARPRNAHHWMVISDELFNYRDNLLRQTAHEHGLDEHWISRWHVVEEAFRPDIVKATPWPRVVDGVELDTEGFGEAVLDEGTLCNSCGREIARGETVRYHLRTGETFCAHCAAMVPDPRV